MVCENNNLIFIKEDFVQLWILFIRDKIQTEE